jgi:hypothetical protein
MLSRNKSGPRPSAAQFAQGAVVAGHAPEQGESIKATCTGKKAIPRATQCADRMASKTQLRPDRSTLAEQPVGLKQRQHRTRGQGEP